MTPRMIIFPALERSRRRHRQAVLRQAVAVRRIPLDVPVLTFGWQSLTRSAASSRFLRENVACC